MDSNFVNSGAVTPVKETVGLNRSKFNESSKNAENVNPNVLSPGLKCSDSRSIKSERSAKKSASRNHHSNFLLASPSPNKKIRGRRFVIAKKKSGTEELNSSTSAVVCSKCEKASGKSRCLCVAYKSLRASQEDFFKNRSEVDDDEAENEGLKIDSVCQNPEIVERLEGEMEGNCNLSEINGESEGSIGVVGVNCEMGSKRSRDMLLKEAGENVPEPGSGRVMHLVKAFEKLLTIPKSNDSEEKEVPERNDDEKGLNWELPGFQQPKVSEPQDSFSFCPSDFFLTSESLGLLSRRSCSLDSSQGSISTQTSAGGRGSRRRSTESVGTLAGRHQKRRQPRATSQKPFMLRTEQRGKYKEEEFMKKLQQMTEEEEKLRIPIAQGLPWSTDEPECVVKPPLKENTRPVDLVLHSDIRAVERAGFDHQVSKKMSLIECYRMERERKEKQEEEEIKRLRKELVPKAQPMPYFNKPFMPKRSMKNPTIPREPKFHLSQNKKMKSCISLDDFCVSLGE